MIVSLLRPPLLFSGLCAVVLACGCTPKAEKKFGESNQQYLQRYLAQSDTDFQRQVVIEVAESPDATAPWAQKSFADLAGVGDPAKKSRDALLRQAAAFGLFKAEHQRVPDLVTLMQKDPAPVVREAAARYLALLAENGRVAQEDWPLVRQVTLERFAAEREVDVKISLIRIMGCIRDKEVLDQLIELLCTENFLIEYQTEQSLGRLTGQTFKNDQSAWKKWEAETKDLFAGGGKVPPQLTKQELNPMERVFINYRWKPKSRTQSPLDPKSWPD